MSEVTAIKTLNGHPLVDTQARADIEDLRKNGGGNTVQTITKTGAVIEMSAGEEDNITIDASGATGVDLIHTGKNLLQPLPEGEANGINWTVKANGKVEISGTVQETGNTFLNLVPKASAIYLPAGTYILSGTVPGVGWGFSVQKTGVSNRLARINSDIPSETFTIEEGTTAIAFFMKTFSVQEEVNATCWVQLERGETATDFVPGCYNRAETALPNTLDAYDGTNLFFSAGGETLTASMQVVKSAGVDEEAVSKLIQQAIAFDPRVYDIPVLTLDGDTSEMSKETKVDLEYTFQDKDGNPIEGTAKVKWQGASSVVTGTAMGGLYNLTVKLDNKVELVEGWGKHKTYCFKANAIDHSHARNICSAKLWGEIVKSRDTVPPELADLPNGGAIDGFPVACMINGAFYALGTLNMPKDEYIFTGDTHAPKAFVSANQHSDATQFRGLATFDGDFDIEYVEEPVESVETTVDEEAVKTSLNTMIQAVMDSDGSDLDTTVGALIDIPSAIDYLIFVVLEKAGDGTDKNYLLVTYDNVKWYFSAYDMDTVWGLQWDGSGFVSPGAGLTFANYGAKHKLMELLLANKGAEIKARAQKLCKGAMSEVNVYNKLTDFSAKIPQALLDENCRRWPLLRSTSQSNVPQILNWYRLRRIFIDSEINKL